MNKKLYFPIAIAIILIVVIGIFFALQGVREPERRPGVTVPKTQEEAGEGRYLVCEVGSGWATGGVKWKVTGIEKHTLGGESMDLCCSEWSQEGLIGKGKICQDTGGANQIMWATDEATKKFYKTMEMYEQDGKSCSKGFYPDGNVTAEMCY